MDTPDLETRIERRLRAVGLVAGPLLALGVYLLNPGGHPPEARRLLAIVTLVIVWWMSEAIPLPATALVGSALAIVAGVAPVKEVLAPYANPVIFLFLGSFLLAEAFRKYGLDRRVARRGHVQRREVGQGVVPAHAREDALGVVAVDGA